MRAAAVAVLVLAACVPPPRPPVELTVERGHGATRLRLAPAPGWRINALLPPAFEESDGSLVRFHAESLSTDSAYFRTAPTATLAGPRRALRGTLRASVCAAGEQVCRPYIERFGS